MSEGTAAGILAMLTADLTEETGPTCPALKEVCRVTDAHCLTEVTKLQVPISHPITILSPNQIALTV